MGDLLRGNHPGDSKIVRCRFVARKLTACQRVAGIHVFKAAIRAREETAHSIHVNSRIKK